MDANVLLPAITAVLAGIFFVALLDQWRTRRRGYQLIWAMGMLFFSIAVACEALAAATGWNEPIYRVWYLTGAVWTAGWLGLGNAYLLGRTRFGFAFAARAGRRIAGGQFEQSHQHDRRLGPGPK